MQYIVFDMEWNQPLGPSLAITSPIRLHGDIIEIGAVKLDENFEVRDTFSAYVCPEFYKKMHRKVGGLTHIDPQKLKTAPAFASVYEDFVNWCGDDYRFITWSGNDLPMLIDNLVVRGMDASDLPDAIDVQEIFADQIMNDTHCYALGKALELMHLPVETCHDALNDAINTVRVMECLDMEEGIRFFDMAYDEEEVCYA